MTSYAVTGASRGIGFEFVSQLSAIPANHVFALVRNTSTATKLQALAEQRPNLHILPGDITDNAQLTAAAEAISAATGGTLDVLIENAAWIDDATVSLTPTTIVPSSASATAFRSSVSKSIQDNVISVVDTTNIFLPLVKKGAEKKIIVLSSGMADLEFILKGELRFHVPYSISKAAVNVIVAKFSIELKDAGVKILSISPGWVNTKETPLTPEELVRHDYLLSLLRKYKPDYEGQLQPAESITAMRKVIDGLSMEQSGQMLSHLGSTVWL